MNFNLSFYQKITLLRSILITTHWLHLTVCDDNMDNWYAMMMLAMAAPLTHIQLFEFSCGHRQNGHLMIVIERALKQDILVFGKHQHLSPHIHTHTHTHTPHTHTQLAFQGRI